MNAVVRSYVRMAIYHGCKCYGVKGSFDGLAKGDLQVGFCIPEVDKLPKYCS